MNSTRQYPGFVDDATFVRMDDSVPENEQLRGMLANLTRIHLLTADKFDSFDALIHEYLLAGTDVFGLETGIVSQISEDEIYTICDVVSPLDVLSKHMQFPLHDTYCKEVFATRSVLGFPEVGKLDYMECHPVYENLKLEAYLSAPIFVEDRLFGTLNFTSTQPRVKGFSKHEHDLILLMANSIGAYILLREKEQKLLDLNDKMKRFVGYVAHDLRNPLGSIIGFARIAEKPKTTDERKNRIIHTIGEEAARALELVSTILESAALRTGKITLDKSVIQSKILLSKVLDSVGPFAQDSKNRCCCKGIWIPLLYVT